MPSPVSQVQSYVDSKVKMELKLGAQTCHSTSELSVFTPSHHRCCIRNCKVIVVQMMKMVGKPLITGSIAWRHRAKKNTFNEHDPHPHYG